MSEFYVYRRGASDYDIRRKENGAVMALDLTCYTEEEAERIAAALNAQAGVVDATEDAIEAARGKE